MSYMSPLSGVKRKLNFGPVRSVDDRRYSDSGLQQNSGQLFALSNLLLGREMLGLRIAASADLFGETDASARIYLDDDPLFSNSKSAEVQGP